MFLGLQYGPFVIDQRMTVIDRGHLATIFSDLVSIEKSSNTEMTIFTNVGTKGLFLPKIELIQRRFITS